MEKESCIKIFLCGDVMTGRGIDQILPHPNNPHIYEDYMHSAIGYIDIAQQANGFFQYPVEFNYIWGDALTEFQKQKPDLRIINLETSITKNEDYEYKGINYRMHPRNVPALISAKIDCCTLANNHVLDWGIKGLKETIQSLNAAKIQFAGAGLNKREAGSPAIMNIEGKGRVILFSFGLPSSGIPQSWAAQSDRPGVNFLETLHNRKFLDQFASEVFQLKQRGDIIIASIHWGGNWGYEIPDMHVEFAHRMIDVAGVDIIHGHSSHHAKGFEIYKKKPILYGCGDFINDYEGITHNDDFRDDLGAMYFINMDIRTGTLIDLEMTPTRIKHMQINYASNSEAYWLQNIFNKESQHFGTKININEYGKLQALW